MVWQLCRRVWARLMDTALIAGVLELPSYYERRREYLSCSWLPPKWDWVDPLKDARTEMEPIDAGLKSRSPRADTMSSRSMRRLLPTKRALGLTFNATTPIAPNPTEGCPSDGSAACGHACRWVYVRQSS
jgi:hypothetical protein